MADTSNYVVSMVLKDLGSRVEQIGRCRNGFQQGEVRIEGT